MWVDRSHSVLSSTVPLNIVWIFRVVRLRSLGWVGARARQPSSNSFRYTKIHGTGVSSGFPPKFYMSSSKAATLPHPTHVQVHAFYLGAGPAGTATYIFRWRFEVNQQFWYQEAMIWVPILHDFFLRWNSLCNVYPCFFLHTHHQVSHSSILFL